MRDIAIRLTFRTTRLKVNTDSPRDNRKFDWGRPTDSPAAIGELINRKTANINVKNYSLYTVMSVCLFALMIVLLIYGVLSIFVILINIILVMSDVYYYYYLYSFYVATLCIERDT